MKFDRVKSASVAIAKVDKSDPTVFEIVGSGVCIDPKGIILTCEHVISAFMSISIPDQTRELPKSEHPQRIEAPSLLVPYAIFYRVDSSSRLLAYICRVDQILASTKQDIGLLRVLPHDGLPEGYPFLEVEDYAEIHEGLEIGTCGFPLGNFLKHQIGAVTSSFTFGRISTISPYEGVSREVVRVFQLDLTATHGNSGGPVFNQSNQKVIGVLQGGIIHTSGSLQAGLARCEPAHKFLAGHEIEYLKSLPLGEPGDLATLRNLQTT